MANKYNSRDFYTAIINSNITTTEIEFARKALEKMDEKKNNRKPTPSQRENAETAKRIAKEIDPETTYTAKEIADKFNLPSTQKATGILLRMVDEGILNRTEYSPTGKAKDKVIGYKKA